MIKLKGTLKDTINQEVSPYQACKLGFALGLASGVMFLSLALDGLEIYKARKSKEIEGTERKQELFEKNQNEVLGYLRAEELEPSSCSFPSIGK